MYGTASRLTAAPMDTEKCIKSSFNVYLQDVSSAACSSFNTGILFYALLALFWYEQ